MPDGYVIDASVIVKLLVEKEEDSPLSQLGGSAIFQEWHAICSHTPLEVTSALRKLLLRKSLDLDDATCYLDRLARVKLYQEPVSYHLHRIWELRDTMTPYDAAYVATAESLQLPLLTVDRKLIKASNCAGVEAVHLDDLSF